MALNAAQMQAFLAAQQAEAREQVLYQFNCGSMELNAVTKKVTADPRKGKVVLTMEDDGLLRFQWRLRHKDENEQQFFIFPSGATWTRVAECPDGAVFLLKFKDSAVRRFYWSQEPRSDAKKSAKKEAQILKKISDLIANPPKFGAPIPKEEEESKEEDEAMVDVPSVSSESGGLATVQGVDRTPLVSETHAGAVVHPATGAVSPPVSATPATTAGTTAATSSTAASSTNSLLSTLNAMAQQLSDRQAAAPGVEDVLEAENVQKILDVDSALVDALVEYLPEGQRSPEALRAQLRSPQLQQTMSRLTSILNSSQFRQLMASLSLPVAANSNLGVDAFIAAIQNQASKQQGKK